MTAPNITSLIILILFINIIENTVVSTKDACYHNFKVLFTQNVENEGFHRLIKWLIEFEDNMMSLNCSIHLKQEIPEGAFVNPDQLADLNRLGLLHSYLEDNVDVELPMHHSKPHIVNLYKHIMYFRATFELPIHLRYQRSQIGGGYGRVELSYPWLLIKCTKNKSVICGNTVKSYDYNGIETISTNLTYLPISQKIEMIVPVGNIDHYPLVSITTFIVTCIGCIYLLSVMLSNPV